MASGINFIDVAGAELLVQEARRRRKIGGGLYLVKAKEGLYESLRRGGYLEEFGVENVFQSKGEAIATIFGKLDREHCRICDKRIFSECVTIEFAGMANDAVH